MNTKELIKPKSSWIYWILGAHIFVWVLAHGVSDTNLDGYADMLENFAWGQHLEWGSAKHPPLFAWVTGVWFAVLPTQDVFYHLLSYGNAALGLLGVYRLAMAMQKPQWAWPSVVLLCLAFPYSTLAVKFNANAILLSVWPWVAVAWWHSVHKNTQLPWLASVALGLLSALAMLGKYYSGVFLLSIFLVSLTFKTGREWFKSYHPWLALLVFALGLLPHLHWLKQHDYVTFRYLGDQGGEYGVAWGMVTKFAIIPMAYWLFAWLTCAWVYAPGHPTLVQRLLGWPARLVRSWLPNAWHDTLFWLAMLPWAISLAFGATGFVELSMPWAIPIGYGFSLLWLRNLHTEQVDTALTHQMLKKTFIAWSVLVLLVSPWYAWHQAQKGTENHYLPRREAAAALLKGWQERHPQVPLQWVGGQWAENALLAFYGDNRLQVVAGVPNVFPATVTPLPNWEQQGGLLLCPLGPVERQASTTCPEDMRAWLRSVGQPTQGITLVVQSEGYRFPRSMPFQYLVFDYLPKP